MYIYIYIQCISDLEELFLGHIFNIPECLPGLDYTCVRVIGFTSTYAISTYITT